MQSSSDDESFSTVGVTSPRSDAEEVEQALCDPRVTVVAEEGGSVVFQGHALDAETAAQFVLRVFPSRDVKQWWLKNAKGWLENSDTIHGHLILCRIAEETTQTDATPKEPPVDASPKDAPPKVHSTSSIDLPCRDDTTWNESERLGGGAFGTVYVGRDKLGAANGTAVKVFKASYCDKLLAEVAAHATLRTHCNAPHILKAESYYCHAEGGSLAGYIVYPYKALTLGKWLRERKWDTADLPRVADNIARGLSAVFNSSKKDSPLLKHGDLKSDNILIDVAGMSPCAYVADWGEATDSGSTGTYSYMAPETLRGTPAGEISDVWSYGVLLYEMASAALRGELITARAVYRDLQLLKDNGMSQEDRTKMANILDRPDKPHPLMAKLESLQQEAPPDSNGSDLWLLIHVARRCLQSEQKKRLSSWAAVTEELQLWSKSALTARITSAPAAPPSCISWQRGHDEQCTSAHSRAEGARFQSKASLASQTKVYLDRFQATLRRATYERNAKVERLLGELVESYGEFALRETWDLVTEMSELSAPFEPLKPVCWDSLLRSLIVLVQRDAPRDDRLVDFFFRLVNLICRHMHDLEELGVAIDKP